MNTDLRLVLTGGFLTFGLVVSTRRFPLSRVKGTRVTEEQRSSSLLLLYLGLFEGLTFGTTVPDHRGLERLDTSAVLLDLLEGFCQTLLKHFDHRMELRDRG